jgi:hypothetical protein
VQFCLSANEESYAGDSRESTVMMEVLGDSEGSYTGGNLVRLWLEIRRKSREKVDIKNQVALLFCSV